MPLFRYKAVQKDGKKIDGKVEASSSGEVLNILRQNNLYPVSVKEAILEKDIELPAIFNKVNSKEISVFCRQFFTLLNAGSDILNSVNIIRLQSENKALKESLNGVYEEIQKGSTVSASMKEYPKVFPELLVNMIESGEETGNLTRILQKMTDHYENEAKLSAKIRGAMVYPIVLSIASIGVILFLVTFVLPTFVGMFEGSGVELPTITKGIIALSNAITGYWYLFIIGIIALIIGYRYASKTDKGETIIETLKLNFPLFKSVNRKIITARFTQNLSIILYSGITIINALEIVSGLVGNRLVKKELLSAREEVIRGVALSDAMEKIKVFPPMVVSMVKIGEESGDLDGILEKTAEFYDREVDEGLSKMVTMIEPIMILIMGLVVGTIVLGIALPMFDMYSTI
ncbi:type II secretion system F family protein [Clostridium sp. DL1XJH146]